MKVFLAVASFQPAYGGPARSVSRLAAALTEAGIEVGVWAPDQSAAATSFLGKHDGLRRLQGTAAEALADFGKTDVIHDNGIWLPHNHRLAGLARAHGIPRVVSTRGMLEPWALNHKRWKKRLAWAIYQKRDIRAAAALHATAAREAEQIKCLKLGAPVYMVPNGVDLPASECLRAPSSGPQTALFLGRVHPVKGLPLLVEAWAKVRPKGWRMKIVGPDEVGHRAAVESLVRRHGLEAAFEFVGELEGDAKRMAYESADLFVLPSHTENFGMAIGEALAHALPVITTHGTPWKLLEAERCGWWVAVSVEGIAAALEDATRRSPEERVAMGARGRAWMEREFAWDSVAAGMLRMYDEVAR
jgi:glycosyltransferase involved in cell wall biosynthesis